MGAFKSLDRHTKSSNREAGHKRAEIKQHPDCDCRYVLLRNSEISQKTGHELPNLPKPWTN